MDPLYLSSGICAGFLAAVCAVHLVDLELPGHPVRHPEGAAVHRQRERHPGHGKTGRGGEFLIQSLFCIGDMSERARPSRVALTKIRVILMQQQF